MSDVFVRAASVVSAPRRGRVFAFSSTTTTQFVRLDTVFKDLEGFTGREEPLLTGRFLTLQADGSDVYFALSRNTSGIIDPSAANTLTSNVSNFLDTIPIKIPNNDKISIFVDGPSFGGNEWQLLAFRSVASCLLRVWPSSPRVSV